MSDGFTMCGACYGVNGEHEYSNCVYAPPPDPLATLRADVERAFLGLVDRPRSDDYLRGVDELYGRVLDLIDKQREGQ